MDKPGFLADDSSVVVIDGVIEVLDEDDSSEGEVVTEVFIDSQSDEVID